jgi:pimeloyl-ACP methyl ester carboxylesterase
MGMVREVWPEADTTALRAAPAAFFRGMGPRALRILEREGLVPDSLRGVPWDSLDLQNTLSDDRMRTRAWRINFAAANSCTGDGWRAMEGGMAFHNPAVSRNLTRRADYGRRTSGFWPALRGFGGPVRVVMGSCDFVDPGPAIWPRVLARLRDGSVEVVPGTGHNPWLDEPARFSGAVLRAAGEATR